MGRISTSGTESFAYDKAGNISCNGQNSTSPYYTYNSANEQTYSYASCYSSATQENTFTYDVYGDRIEETYPSGGNQVPLYYAYTNSLGQMTSYTAFFTTTNYTYNGDGQLMDESQGSTNLATMTWDDAEPTPKILSDNTWDFIYGPNGLVFEAIKSSTPTYFFNDSQTSVVADISISGTPSNVNVYDTWGKAPISGAPPISFDNSYYDSATGFFYLTNRFYDYEKAQFITVEPRILATSQPYGYGGVITPGSGGLSTIGPMGVTQTGYYQFANDNPVNESDMTGLCGGCGLARSDAAFALTTSGLYTESMIMDTALIPSLVAMGGLGGLFVGGLFAYLEITDLQHNISRLNDVSTALSLCH